MQDIKPELDKLKEKHKDDKQALAKAQMELYQKHGINPVGSLVPMVVQFIVLIALFQAFNNVVKPSDAGVGELNKVLYPFVQLPPNSQLNSKFLYLDVTQPDVFKLPFTLNLGPITFNALPGLFLILAAAVQFISSKMMMPGRQARSSANIAKKGGGASDEDMAMTMQKQMLLITPIMTLIIGLSFASGLVLYWITFSVMMIAQQLYVQNMQKKQALKAETK